MEVYMILFGAFLFWASPVLIPLIGALLWCGLLRWLDNIEPWPYDPKPPVVWKEKDMEK